MNISNQLSPPRTQDGDKMTSIKAFLLTRVSVSDGKAQDCVEQYGKSYMQFRIEKGTYEVYGVGDVADFLGIDLDD